MHEQGQNSNAIVVLILIVVEDGLVLATVTDDTPAESCLNPYCSGRWSRTSNVTSIQQLVLSHVLILIVVEDGLVPYFCSC